MPLSFRKQCLREELSSRNSSRPALKKISRAAAKRFASEELADQVKSLVSARIGDETMEVAGSVVSQAIITPNVEEYCALPTSEVKLIFCRAVVERSR